MFVVYSFTECWTHWQIWSKLSNPLLFAIECHLSIVIGISYAIGLENHLLIIVKQWWKIQQTIFHRYSIVFAQRFVYLTNRTFDWQYVRHICRSLHLFTHTKEPPWVTIIEGEGLIIMTKVNSFDWMNRIEIDVGVCIYTLTSVIDKEWHTYTRTPFIESILFASFFSARFQTKRIKVSQ